MRDISDAGKFDIGYLRRSTARIKNPPSKILDRMTMRDNIRVSSRQDYVSLKHALEAYKTSKEEMDKNEKSTQITYDTIHLK